MLGSLSRQALSCSIGALCSPLAVLSSSLPSSTLFRSTASCLSISSLGSSSSVLQRAYHRGLSSSAAEGSKGGPPAFVFDIDGVLIRGRNVLPEAKRALARLYEGDGQTPQYPVCFLTNGGGVSEAEKAEQLSGWLGVNVQEDQVVLSHTPMRALAPIFGDVPVLVAGRGKVRSVASDVYGFSKVTTTAQLGRAMPSATPFATYLDDGVAHEGDAPCPIRDHGWGSPEAPFQAVLVMTDPSDWARDLQLIVDAVLSGGAPGLHAIPPGGAAPHVYFSNPDLLWANDFPAPRFGQGAFATALEALHKEVTTRPLKGKTFFGKPNAAPFRIAEQLLVKQAIKLGHAPAGVDADPFSGAQLPFNSIFMVGDNPAADVRGANAAGLPWTSVLVRTGVFRGGVNDAVDPARFVVEHVDEAVQLGLAHAETA